ncbi:MAG: PIN domain-containing protein [Solirubrobacterales bacterium]
MIVLDTSFVLALLDDGDSEHIRAAKWYAGVGDLFATTPLVLAELDYLLHSRAAPAATHAFYEQIRRGSLGVEWWPGLENEASEVAGRYAEVGLGLVDASLVVLAARLETVRIASFDERHFRAVEPLAGADSFELLPADA